MKLSKEPYRMRALYLVAQENFNQISIAISKGHYFPGYEYDQVKKDAIIRDN